LTTQHLNWCMGGANASPFFLLEVCLKIAEKVHHDDGGKTLTIESVYDMEPTINQVKDLKQVGFDQQKGDNRLVGRIPMNIMAQWLKEAGVKWDDHKAAEEVIKRKILSGDFSKFRVWEGTF
jgi:hypothetical protein